MDQQSEAIAKSILFQLHPIHNLTPYLDSANLVTQIYTTVTPSLDYYNTICVTVYLIGTNAAARLQSAS